MSENIMNLRGRFRPGTQIRLIRMNDRFPVAPGTQGTVDHVDDIGQVHMHWEDGRTLALIPEIDEFEIIEEETPPR